MNRIEDNLHHVGANEALIKALMARDVEFVIVGGLAVSWYCSARQADDMDILVNPTEENSQKVANALTDLNLHGFSAHSFSKLGVQAPIKRHYYVDIITPSTKGPAFSDIVSSSVQAKLFKLPIRIASPEKLISMKEQAAESSEADLKKHRDDIACLKEYAL